MPQPKEMEEFNREYHHIDVNECVYYKNGE